MQGQNELISSSCRQNLFQLDENFSNHNDNDDNDGNYSDSVDYRLLNSHNIDLNIKGKGIKDFFKEGPDGM